MPHILAGWMAAASVFLLATDAMAQTTAPQPRRAASPVPLASLDELVGSWEGSGSFVRTKAPLASTTTIEKIIGGDALRMRHSEKPPHKFVYDALISNDSVTGDLVLLMASNNTGGARVFRSSGWQNKRLVFTADKMLQSWFAPERLSFERLDADSFKVTYEMSLDAGVTWRTGDIQTYRRVR